MKSRFLDWFTIRVEAEDFRKPSVLALLAVNILPLVGVLLLGWDVFLVLLLFWLENVVIGMYNVLKLLSLSSPQASWPKKIPAALFFCLHYGLFTLVHGVFVFVVFGGDAVRDNVFGDIPGLPLTLILQISWAALALLVSHGVSFYFNFLRGGEYLQSSVDEVMQQPYGRVVIMHLTIIFGAILVAAIGSPAAALIPLILIKTGIDLWAHLRQHNKYPKHAGI